MKVAVVDTNVIATANLAADHAPDDCVMTSIDTLRQLREHGVIALDDGFRILCEYLRHASRAGQPGVGDAFVKHMCDHLYDANRCLLVSITPRDEADDFEEFPDDAALAKFDRDDRKFVAVARASEPAATIFNATDTGWWPFRQVLRRHGVVVNFLCPSLMPNGE